MVDEKIAALQSEFLKRLEKHCPPPEYNVPQILHRILECDADTLQFSRQVLGKNSYLLPKK